MAELAITKIRQSPFVTVSMIAMCVAGIVSWIILMAGAAAVESDKNKKIDVDDADDFFGASFSAYSGVALAVDLGFSWWLMVYTGLLYVFATLVWLLSMAKGVSVFVAASQPLALLFTVAFAWTGVEMRNARALTGYVRSNHDSAAISPAFTQIFRLFCTSQSENVCMVVMQPNSPERGLAIVREGCTEKLLPRHA